MPSIVDDPVHHLEADGETVHAPLEIITSPEPPRKPDWFDDEKVLRLGERYEFDMLPRLSLPLVVGYVETKPVDVFVFACKNERVDLAKNAISHFGVFADHSSVDSVDLDLIARITSSYLYSLIQAMCRVNKNDAASTVHWPDVADRFRLPKPE